MPTARKPRNGGPPAIPNAMLRTQTAQVVIQRLSAIQAVRKSLEGLQVAGEYTDTDVVPGAEPKEKDGQIVYENDEPVYPTFGELKAAGDASQARVWAWAKQEGVATLVERMTKINAEREEVLGEEHHG